MRTEQLDYQLPVELIAQQPSELRGDSRLLVLNRRSGRLIDSRFDNIGEFLSAGDCLVLNDTKVLPARFFARRQTGGRLEGLFLTETQRGVWQVLLKGAAKLTVGETITLGRPGGSNASALYKAVVLGRQGQGGFTLRMDGQAAAEEILEQVGFPPLPPYIKRGTDLRQAGLDRLRYQTVYAAKPGAVAAPTAGLHFTERLIERLKQRQINFAVVTLHVGAGTFRPIRAELLEEHQIHPEQYAVAPESARIINRTKKDGGRIVAVGTTTVRTLETAAAGSQVAAGGGTSSLFIRPGYSFRIVDAIVTNFHLPRSSLLALVAAFAGIDAILAAYSYAVENRYRFYSYGDAMLII